MACFYVEVLENALEIFLQVFSMWHFKIKEGK